MYYPVYLNLKGKKCVVVGAGRVAVRKVGSLLKSGAEVVLISPRIDKNLARLSRQKKITYRRKNFEAKDLSGAFLVIGATDNSRINDEISRVAEEKGILVNIVDLPVRCNFIVPSRVKRGDLSIAISTSGKSPLLAKRIRQELELVYGREYALFLKLMEKLRPEIIKNIPEPKKRAEVFKKIVDSDIIKLIKQGEKKLVRERIKEIMTLAE